LFEQKVRALGAFGLDDGGQSVHPLARFLAVGVTANLEWQRWGAVGCWVRHVAPHGFVVDP
jgi:hypothetical protein